MNGTKVYYQLRTEDRMQFSTEGLTFTPNVTHVQVALCPSDWSKDKIFEYFNIGDGINQAFADKIKATPNLHHTSMSVGDIVMTEDNRVFACDDCGWKELAHISPDFREIWR